jgi:GNAT superfamily N-acetyltransferase
MIQYGYLADHMHMCEEIALYSYNEWPLESQIDEELNSAKDVAEMFRKDYANGRGNVLDSAIVAFIDNESKEKEKEFAGIVVLTDCDLKSKRNEILYTPWVCNLFVKEKFRNRGIAKELVNRCCEMAKNLGFTCIYLWAKFENVSLYEILGFEHVEKIFHIHQDIYIMLKPL